MCFKQAKQKTLVITVVITSVILSILAICVGYLGTKAVEISIEQDTVLSQVAQDWSARPWTQIRVRNLKCDYDTDRAEPLFYRDWSGTKPGCKVPDDNGDWKVVTQEQAKAEGRQCIEIEAEPAV